MALDQHGALLQMGVIVSQHHLTGRLCWSWLSWFICLSTRKWWRPPGGTAGAAAAGWPGCPKRSGGDSAAHSTSPPVPCRPVAGVTGAIHGGRAPGACVRLCAGDVGHTETEGCTTRSLARCAAVWGG